VLSEYAIYPALTDKLDTLKARGFDRETLYEIVLWKLGRFPELEDSLIEDLKSVDKLRPKQHRKARELISRLLRTPGIGLPMASAVLRFLNPQTFQIIDDRSYRVLCPRKPKYPSKPRALNDHFVNTSVEIYCEYLDELHRVASKNLPFDLADRILYRLDILLGNSIGDKNLVARSTRPRRKPRAG
jgi:hypothetical protein